MHLNLTLGRDEIVALEKQYRQDEEGMGRENAALQAGRLIASGCYTAENLLAIAIWKAERAKGHIKKNLPEDVADALEAALKCRTTRAKVAVLCGLHGVAVPMASAILTAVYPDNTFTIIDRRALQALGDEDWDTRQPSIDDYIEYLAFCRGAAADLDVKLRVLDRALWQKSANAG